MPARLAVAGRALQDVLVRCGRFRDATGRLLTSVGGGLWRGTGCAAGVVPRKTYSTLSTSGQVRDSLD